MPNAVSAGKCLAVAIVAASTFVGDRAPAFENKQDAQFRAQARQKMQLRSLQQRIESDRASDRAQRAAERANRAYRRALRRAKSK